MALELKTFTPGGIHAPDCKELTEKVAITNAEIPNEVILPLSQHAGAPAKPVVEVGQEVKAGQKIAEASSMISAPIHATISGKIKAIEPRQTIMGRPIESMVIEASEEQGEPEIINRNVDELSAEQIVEIVREAGIVGLGGAAFPTHVKLSPPKDTKIEYVIINGCECEPYLTCDHRQMLEEADELIAGTKLLLKAVGAPKAYIGIESNKMDAIELLAQKTKNIAEIEVVGVQTRYPQGAERQLIQAILKREVPIGGLPSSVGALVQNVGTTISIYKACAFEKPLIDRVVTVSGHSINEPKNLRVRLGTPVQDIINQCGGFKDNVAKVIVGGPMTGFGVFDFSVPVVKGTSGVLALSKDEISVEEIKACVRCGKCVQNCPMGVEPLFVTAHVQLDLIEEALDLGLMNCCECGICAYVCPSNRPLVQLLKFGKSLAASKKA
jgi:electron transport complex protein RnfC